MKTFLSVLGLIGALGTSATAQDWGGFYAGGSFGDHDGEKCYVGNACPEYFITGQDVSIFGGYNVTSGPWVYGAEFFVNVTGQANETLETDYILTNFVDLKLRSGYAHGQALYFTSVGYSMADADEDGDDYYADGLIVGFGADYLMTDNIFVGAEYTSRFLLGAKGTSEYFAEQVNTLSFRVGYNF